VGEGEVLGWNIGYADVQEIDWVFYNLTHPGCCDASQFSDLRLAPGEGEVWRNPSSVEGTTWGRLKATFK